MKKKPTLLFYCQHSMGMGHLVRSFGLARALAERFRVVILNGGRFPGNFKPPPNVEIIQLIPLGMGSDGVLISRDEEYGVEQAQNLRVQKILKAYQDLKPSVILLELYPFGRRKFGFELLPLLDAAVESTENRPHIVCSVRDLLVHGKKHQKKRDNQACEVANQYLDVVLVHADPGFARLEETFQPEQPLRPPVHYTGFVLPLRKECQTAKRSHRVVVSAGGGIVGGGLYRAAIEAQHILWDTEGLQMTLIAGPFLPEKEWSDLQKQAQTCPGLKLHRSVPDVFSELQSAAASVSQCGYNTAMEILESGIPALVVPYQEGNENEQMNRARRLEELGTLRVLPPDSIQGENLAGEIRSLLRFQPATNTLDLSGASHSARLIRELLPPQKKEQNERSENE